MSQEPSATLRQLVNAVLTESEPMRVTHVDLPHLLAKLIFAKDTLPYKA